MPFKTRRQKISAQQRRYVFSNGKVNFDGVDESHSEKDSAPSLASQNKVETFGETKVLKSELIRIGTISFVIIALQVALRTTPVSSYLSVLR